MKRLGLLISLMCAAVAFTENARGQDWPTRPVKLIVPTGAGSATDTMARLLANGVAETLGQPMVVENMPGASGILAHQSVARATNDGYTLLFTNTSGLAINPVSFKKLPYDPERDFTAVAMVSNLGPQMLSVNAKLPIQNMPELVSYAKANRGKLSLGFDNTAGAAAFAAKLIDKRADLGLIEVPYRSGPQAVHDAAGGTTQFLVSSIAAARSVVEAGKIRRIAVTSSKRFPGLPDLPSVSETVPGVVINGWFAVVAPAGTAAGIVQKLNSQIDRFLKGQDIRQRLLDIGLATDGAGTPASAATYIRDSQKQWQGIAKELNIEPQ